MPWRASIAGTRSARLVLAFFAMWSVCACRRSNTDSPTAHRVTPSRQLAPSTPIPSVDEDPDFMWLTLTNAAVIGVGEIGAVETFGEIPRYTLTRYRPIRGEPIDTIVDSIRECPETKLEVERALRAARRSGAAQPSVLLVGMRSWNEADAAEPAWARERCTMQVVTDGDAAVRWVEDVVAAQHACRVALSRWTCPASRVAPDASVSTQDIADTLLCGHPLDESVLPRDSYVGCIGREPPASSEERFLDAIDDHFAATACVDRSFGLMACRQNWLVALNERFCMEQRRRVQPDEPPRPGWLSFMPTSYERAE